MHNGQKRSCGTKNVFFCCFSGVCWVPRWCFILQSAEVLSQQRFVCLLRCCVLLILNQQKVLALIGSGTPFELNFRRTFAQIIFQAQMSLVSDLEPKFFLALLNGTRRTHAELLTNVNVHVKTVSAREQRREESEIDR